MAKNNIDKTPSGEKITTQKKSDEEDEREKKTSKRNLVCSAVPEEDGLTLRDTVGPEPTTTVMEATPCPIGSSTASENVLFKKQMKPQTTRENKERERGKRVL